ncbi:uncharacterized protein EDB91DRAFT_1048347 [Suillus paluster]|uniref:uncharacterized protein n=1 Tax=Suillus paluster TaxID=48578 RepID=UPI001B885118|nr:uncharacterized protein EDB91DRAFT_1048347 [Suillus paluster]KAG1748009.1 hypothetical protein EDB91DRAFT_1048347 [Suillus paluster]
MKIDRLFQKTEKKQLQEFSRDSVLHAVVEFVVCDDQSLVLANNTTFRNCLVAMHPAATVADLPSTHNVTTYIHNSFIKLIKDIKAEMQVHFFI